MAFMLVGPPDPELELLGWLLSLSPFVLIPPAPAIIVCEGGGTGDTQTAPFSSIAQSQKTLKRPSS